eukprot:g2325.t1
MVVGSAGNAGRAALTHARVLRHGTYRGQPVSVVRLAPLTGRRHQLRLHLSHAGYCIVGDATYGGARDDAPPRMMLHALALHMPKCAGADGLQSIDADTQDPFLPLLDTPGVRFVPEVQFNGSWYPICGAKMRENNNAADTICKQLGFSGGGAVVPMPSEWCTSTDTNGWRGTERPCYFRIDSFEVNASMMPIGKCGKGQPLHECDQGGNEWGNVDWQLPKPNYPVTPCRPTNTHQCQRCVPQAEQLCNVVFRSSQRF